MKLSQLQQNLKIEQEKQNKDIFEMWQQCQQRTEADLKLLYNEMLKNTENYIKEQTNKQLQSQQSQIENIDWELQQIRERKLYLWIGIGIGVGILIEYIVGIVDLIMKLKG